MASLGPKVAALGVGSVLAAELATEDRRIGAINLYWRRPRVISVDDAAYAHIFARHAALALQASLNDAHLHVALDTRKVIGAAQGVLMERHGLTMDQAFQVLVRYSQDHNLKLRRIAEQLIATRELPADGGPGSRRLGPTDQGKLRSAPEPDLRLRASKPVGRETATNR